MPTPGMLHVEEHEIGPGPGADREQAGREELEDHRPDGDAAEQRLADWVRTSWTIGRHAVELRGTAT